MPVNTNGITIIICFCVGSPVAGVIHCCQSIVAPMRIGVT